MISRGLSVSQPKGPFPTGVEWWASETLVLPSVCHSSHTIKRVYGKQPRIMAGRKTEDSTRDQRESDNRHWARSHFAAGHRTAHLHLKAHWDFLKSATDFQNGHTCIPTQFKRLTLPPWEAWYSKMCKNGNWEEMSCLHNHRLLVFSMCDIWNIVADTVTISHAPCTLKHLTQSGLYMIQYITHSH